MSGYTGDLDLLVDTVTNNAGPTYGPYIKHVLSYWDNKDTHPMLIVSYEDMQHDLEKVIEKVANYLGLPPLSEANVKRLKEHLSFKRMKDNKMVNKEGTVRV